MTRKWDSLDIAQLVETSLDGFSSEFYGCPWDEMKDRAASRVLAALLEHVKDLKEAQS